MKLPQIYRGESIGLHLSANFPLADWRFRIELFTSYLAYKVVCEHPHQNDFALPALIEHDVLKVNIPAAVCRNLSEGILSLRIEMSSGDAVRIGTFRIAELLSVNIPSANQNMPIEHQLCIVENELSFELRIGSNIALNGISPTIGFVEEGDDIRLCITDAKGTKTTPNIRGKKGDSGPGVPTGGTPGQVLTKAGGEDYATEWRNPSGGGITPEELGRIALRYDSLQSLSTKDQSTALKNIGLPTFIVSYSELPKVLTDAEAESLELAALLRVDNYQSSNGSRTLIMESYPTYNSRVGFQTRMDGSRVLYVNYEKATKTLSVAAGFLTDINAVSFQFQQKLTPTQRYIARTNIFSVGYLCLAATLGADADNRPLVVTSSLAEVQAAFEQFWANPGRYRWSLVINSSADMNPFVEEAELEPLHRDDGGLELQFTSKRSGLRYAIVLTREEFVITAVRVENRLREEWKAYLAAGASFDPLTGYFKVNQIEDIPLREIEAMYALYDGRKRVNLQEQFANSTVRTNFPIWTQWATVNMDRAFQNCLQLSRVAISTFPGSMMYAFYNCPKLERIIGVLDLWFAAAAATANAFDGCAQLRSVRINRLRNTISFKDSPHLSLESLHYLIGHAANTAAITVTVHSDVYARLIDPTQAEWYALNEQAAAKNIAFATV